MRIYDNKVLLYKLREIMELAEIISVDRDKCANCHVCINVCPVKVCNVAMDDHVEINPDLCIGCGQCIEACQFEARNGMDDLQKSLVALQDKLYSII